jgi:hypothetical protein
LLANIVDDAALDGSALFGENVEDGLLALLLLFTTKSSLDGSSLHGEVAVAGVNAALGEDDEITICSLHGRIHRLRRSGTSRTGEDHFVSGRLSILLSPETADARVVREGHGEGLIEECCLAGENRAESVSVLAVSVCIDEVEVVFKVGEGTIRNGERSPQADQVGGSVVGRLALLLANDERSALTSGSGNAGSGGGVALVEAGSSGRGR